MEFKLILKKLNNTLSEEEAAIFWKWYSDSDLHKGYFEKVKQAQQDETLLVDVEKAWESIEKKIKPVSSKKTNYLKYAVAASVALLISLSVIYKKTDIFNSPSQASPIIVNNNIKIGTDKATLTLGDGTIVILEKGKQYIKDNLESTGKDLVYCKSKAAKSEVIYNYLTIPRGGQYHLVLSDGTEIWLNSESQIKYPTVFIEEQTREVELVYGEAYFDVSPSTKHKGAKFKVYTGLKVIEVLGTEFNIKAYKEESNIFTTLIEGKVIVSHGAFQPKDLKPGEQAVLNKDNNSVVILEVDANSEIAWKRGFFNFKNKNLKEIMQVLSRWYDVDVVFKDKKLETIQFKGVISREQSMIEILDLIKNTNFINAYDINNKTIIIKN